LRQFYISNELLSRVLVPNVLNNPMSKKNALKKDTKIGKSPQDEKTTALIVRSEYAGIHHSFWKTTLLGQEKLKNQFRILCLSFLIAASSVMISGQQSFSQLVGQEDKWLPYSLQIEDGNVVYEITIPYPSTWTQRDGSGEEGGASKVADFISPITPMGDFAQLNVFVDNVADMDVEGYLETSIDYYRSLDHEIVSSDVGDFALAGMPTYTLESSFQLDEYGRQKMLEVGTIIGDSAFYVNCIVDSPLYEEYLPTCEQMISLIELRSYTGMTNSPAGDLGSGSPLEGLRAASGYPPSPPPPAAAPASGSTGSNTLT
jgi:hypothetical protein